MAFSEEHLRRMSESARARPPRSGTGVKGVTWAKDRGQYKVYLQTPTGTVKHLGYFDDLADAKAARKAGEARYWPKVKKPASVKPSLANVWARPLN